MEKAYLCRSIIHKDAAFAAIQCYLIIITKLSKTLIVTDKHFLLLTDKHLIDMRNSFTLIAVCALSLSCSLNAMADEEIINATELTSRFVKNPSFEEGTSDWTSANLSAQTNTSFKLKQGNTYLEKWTGAGNSVGSASVMQTISGLPAGHYRLVVAAQNIQQNSAASQTGAVILAGTSSTAVTATADYAVEFAYGTGNVQIGFRATNATGNWLAVDNFRLYFLRADAELLQQAATAAESTLKGAMQPQFLTALKQAIDQAKALDDNAEDEALKDASFALCDALAAAKQNVLTFSNLKKLFTSSRTMLNRKMAGTYRDALQAAYDAAAPIVNDGSDDDINVVLNALQKAYDDASQSYTAYTALNKAINVASRLDTEGMEGADQFLEALKKAQEVLDSNESTPEQMDAATAALEDATLLFHVQNPTGNALNVKTLSAVQGATEIFGRMLVSGGTAREKGFCYSTEESEPTIFDERTSFFYSNNGDIYALQGLKPATFYYIRAYAISSGYQVSYGDVIKLPTRPLGNATFSYDNAGDAATNNRIESACEEAVWMWNNITGIRNFHLSAHYVPGAGANGGTADCSYGGYMRVSQNVPYQRTGTILHEGAHGQGMVPYTDWTNPIYRTNGDRGDWLGPRVDRIIQFLDNNKSAKLHGDHQHMWPYGINGAGEDNGTPILYRANALLVGALAEDGIKTPNQDFMKPAYSFAQEDEVKYYIKSEDTRRGLATSYLRQQGPAALRFEEMPAADALSNDSCAWYITFDPVTCYYTLQNVATGRYLSATTGTANVASTLSNAKFQLLGARTQTKFEDFTFSGTSFWMTTASNHSALNATTTGAATTSFNHADDATTQRWLFLTRDEVIRFAEARGEELGISAPSAQLGEGNVSVAGGQGFIAVTAHGRGQQVRVYTADGRSVSRLYVQRDATARLTMPRGLYLVGGQKVIVR